MHSIPKQVIKTTCLYCLIPYKAKSDRAPEVPSKPTLVKSHVVDLESNRRSIMNLSRLSRDVYLRELNAREA